LPAGLVRIRHYGILGNNRRQRDIAKARAIFERRGSQPANSTAHEQLHPLRCPHCGEAGLRLLGWIDPYGLRHSLRLRPLILDSS